MSRPRRRLLVAAVAVLLLAGCGGPDAAPPAAPAEPSAPAAPEPPPGASEASFVSLDALPDAVVAAIADASDRFGVPEAEVAVAGALRVVWSDGALGCPEDGTFSTQALVPGYLLTLEVEGRRVAYHGAEGGTPQFCAD